MCMSFLHLHTMEPWKRRERREKREKREEREQQRTQHVNTTKNYAITKEKRSENQKQKNNKNNTYRWSGVLESVRTILGTRQT